MTHNKKQPRQKEESKEILTRRKELGKRAYEAERRENASPPHSRERTVMARLFAAMNWRSNNLRKQKK